MKREVLPDENVYSVKTDEEFFNKFMEMSVKVRALGSYFQNEGLELPEEQVLNYEEEFDMLMIELNEVRFEATRRFEVVK